MAKTAAERARDYRARKRRERDAAAAPAAAVSAPTASPADPPSPPDVAIAGGIREEVEIALTAMKWITASDGALVAIVRQKAAQIDRWEASDDPKLWSRADRAGQLLIRALHELGGTPTVRMQHELRSMRAGTRPAEVPDDDEGSTAQPAPGGVVTSFKRPPKRGRGA